MRYVLLLAAVGVMVYAFLDCWRRTDDEVRVFTRPVWIMMILLFWLVGGVAYLAFGRVPLTAEPRRSVLGPDDDPEFLHRLAAQQRRATEERRRQTRRDQAAERDAEPAAQSETSAAEPAPPLGSQTRDDQDPGPRDGGENHSENPSG